METFSIHKYMKIVFIKRIKSQNSFHQGTVKIVSYSYIASLYDYSFRIIIKDTSSVIPKIKNLIHLKM